MLKRKLSIILASFLFVSFFPTVNTLAKDSVKNTTDVCYTNVLERADPAGTITIASNSPFSNYLGAGDTSGMSVAAKHSFNGNSLNVALTVQSLYYAGSSGVINIDSLSSNQSLWLEIKEENVFGNPGRTIYKGDCVGMKVGREVWYKYNLPIKSGKNLFFYVYTTNAKDVTGMVKIRAYTR